MLVVLKISQFQKYGQDLFETEVTKQMYSSIARVINMLIIFSAILDWAYEEQFRDQTFQMWIQGKRFNPAMERTNR